MIAGFLFKEEEGGYMGKRLYPTKLREEKESELLCSIRSRKSRSDGKDDKSGFLVYFRVNKVFHLIGEKK